MLNNDRHNLFESICTLLQNKLDSTQSCVFRRSQNFALCYMLDYLVLLLTVLSLISRQPFLSAV